MSGLGLTKPVKVDSLNNGKNSKQGASGERTKTIFKKKKQGMQTFAYLLHQPQLVERENFFIFFLRV